MSLQHVLPLEGVTLRPTNTLVDRALSRLGEGPLSTEQLAAEVLALRGNPRAAAAAVFTLLGSEKRARVDARGVWSLARPEPGPSASVPLSLQRWVVVDVETTGGSIGFGHRMIEIGMVCVTEGRIEQTYSSLVNPGIPVPSMITSLTGITQRMVDPAPRFDAIAPEVEALLSGRVFVGHNAGFDWRFVSHEMERSTARGLTGSKLCTLRLARRLLSHLPSRSLGSLAEYFGIPMETHHRALDDALATAHLLLRLIEMLEDREIRDWDAAEAFIRKRRRRKRRRHDAMPRSADAA